jgi:cobalamin-dependent methionine synthase I
MDKLMSSNGDEAASERLHPAGGAQASSLPMDDSEELIAEEAKLGVRKPTRVRPVVGDTTHTTRSSVSAEAPVPNPPFFGSRVVDRIPLNNVFQFVNEKSTGRLCPNMCGLFTKN